LLAPALASSGDRSPAFQSCLTHCTSTTCSALNPSPPLLALALRLTRWSCADNCAYECMHSLESLPGAKPQQYYGKWPFIRLLGAQEPLAVLASIGNGWMHVRGLRHIRRRLSGWQDGLGLQRWLEIYAYVGMNAWLWSTVFHTRDTPWTERADYFSAAGALMYSFYFTLVRLLHLYTPSAAHWRYRLFGLLALVYAAHVSYLTWLPSVLKHLPRFDYGYNMLFAVLLGLSHNFLWLLATSSGTSIFPPPQIRNSYKPLAFVLLTTAATSLELLDFPPLWGALDAHALWHVVTIPIVPFWYGWLVQDVGDVEAEAARLRGERVK
ncbi:Per1-like protein, partial [Calocera viscosa TUFC12733]